MYLSTTFCVSGTVIGLGLTRMGKTDTQALQFCKKELQHRVDDSFFQGTGWISCPFQSMEYSRYSLSISGWNGPDLPFHRIYLSIRQPPLLSDQATTWEHKPCRWCFSCPSIQTESAKACWTNERTKQVGISVCISNPALDRSFEKR